MKPAMKIQHVVPILNVSDVPASILWFQNLGWACGFCWNEGGMIAHGRTSNELGAASFAGVCSREAEIFLCRDGQGSRPRDLSADPDHSGVWMSWFLDSAAEVDAMHAQAVDLGYLITQPPRDEPWGVREFHLRHPDGHMFRVGAGIAEH